MIRVAVYLLLFFLATNSLAMMGFGSPVDMPHKVGRQDLFDAVLSSDDTRVEALLSQDASDVNAFYLVDEKAGKRGWRVAELAVINDDVEMLKLLALNGATLTNVMKTEISLLDYAVWFESGKCIAWLLEQEMPPAVIFNAATRALRGGRFKAVEHLLSDKKSLEVLRSASAGVLSALLSDYPDSPRSGRLEMIKSLLSEGFDPARPQSDSERLLKTARHDINALRLLSADPVVEKYLAGFSTPGVDARLGEWSNGVEGSESVILRLFSDGTGNVQGHAGEPLWFYWSDTIAEGEALLGGHYNNKARMNFKYFPEDEVLKLWILNHSGERFVTLKRR